MLEKNSIFQLRIIFFSYYFKLVINQNYFHNFLSLLKIEGTIKISRTTFQNQSNLKIEVFKIITIAAPLISSLGQQKKFLRQFWYVLTSSTQLCVTFKKIILSVTLYHEATLNYDPKVDIISALSICNYKQKDGILICFSEFSYLLLTC